MPDLRGNPRRRRTVAPGWARILPWIGFRYDHFRHAFVIRVVGNRLGPVIQPEIQPHQANQASAGPTEG